MSHKAKAKDSDPKAKAEDLSHKAKAKDSDPKAKAEDLGHEAKVKDSRYQGQVFHQSSSYSVHNFSSLMLCECYVRVLFHVLATFRQFMNKWTYVIAVNDK